MKKKIRNILALWLAGMMLTVTGCQKNGEVKSSESSEAAAAASETPSAAEKQETVHGFSQESSEELRLLASEIVTYHHEKSGATLVCIRNDDPELAFTITYHTPYIDEADTNHIFEHSIIASSEKYPSQDLFFDIVNKSYHTYVNAYTANAFTSYPLSSTSEEQLIRMMDAYLSCMAAPDILTNENIFKREALRYELEDKESPIVMTGTVYSEDFGYLTDVYQEAFNNVADALYPGEYASNLLGRAHRNYQDLTYERTIDLYNKFYHFDNSLIILYGDMDYDRVMKFLDEAWLSQAEPHDTELAPYLDGPSEDGFKDVTCQSPAYEGDQTENASVINYVIDMSDRSWTELVRWNILTTILSNSASPLGKALQEAGIAAPYALGIDYYSSKPYLNFVLDNTNEDQKQAFYQTVEQVMQDIAENGLDPLLVESTLKAGEISLSAARDASNAGVNLFYEISNYWTHTGNTGFYQLLETALDEFLADTDQNLIREMAGSIVRPKHSALVATVPTPGLAEKIEEEVQQYLDEKKASMTEAELDALIADTLAFREWNEQSISNQDFLISPQELPKKEVWDDYEIREEDGITLYRTDSGTDGLSKCALYLDTGSISNEDLYDLSLYLMLLSNFDTDRYSYEEIQMLLPEYLNSMSLRLMYPGTDAGENHHPMLRIQWYCMAEDFEKSLDFLMELLQNSHTDDVEQMVYILDRDMDGYDLSRTGDPLGLARNMALEGAGLMADSWSYANAAGDQEFYRFLKDLRQRLNEDPSAVRGIHDRLERIAGQILVKGRVNFIAAAPKERLDAICDMMTGCVSAWKPAEEQISAFRLSESCQKRGVIVEGSSNYSVMLGDFLHDEEMKGRYLPFMTMVSDRYLIPKLRFQMGAYSAGGFTNVLQGICQIYTYSDPNVGETVDVMNGTADRIEKAELTQEELNGYILSAYGNATAPAGYLTDKTENIQLVILGRDLKEEADLTNDMLNASVSDQQKAADSIRRSLSRGMLVTVGTEKAIQADASCFDEVMNLKEK